MSIEELFALNVTDPQQVVDYGKLRCSETVEFLPSNEAKAYNLISFGYDHIFIACKRNGELDYIWLGQFTAKDWDGNMIYPQIKGSNHLRDNIVACKEKYKQVFTEKQYLELPAKMTVDGKVYSKANYIKQIMHEGKKISFAVYLLD